MVSFIDNKEQKIAKEFLKNGYVIRKVNNEKALTWIKKLFNKIILKKSKLPTSFSSDPFNTTHKYLKKNKLNNFRVNLINAINKDKNLEKNILNVQKII